MSAMENLRLFLIIPPGLEDLALREMILKLPETKHTVIKGGIEVEASLEWMVNAHLLLKIPVRILLRVTEFKVRDFPKLHQKFSKFAWKVFLSHPEPQWEITCRKSRLMHTGRIEETIKKALADALVKQPLSQDWKRKNYSPQTFYIRLEDDNLTLSLDLSGEPLYKRNLQVMKGEAPLRENFAAALLLELFEGQVEKIDLTDPMCGSGTFLIEAATFHLPLHERKFAFEEAPFFKGKLVKLPKAVSSLPLAKITGNELNPELVQKISPILKKYGIDIQSGDALNEKFSSGFMICNPPYGERIKTPGKKGIFLRESLEKFLSQDKPVRLGWLIPSDMEDIIPKVKGYKIKSKRKFRNGGLAVTFQVWEREG
jgi:putative N6-adenine-specific DNA methylase